jgi:phosphatidylinositol alpha-1,6-mannosyltransferase
LRSRAIFCISDYTNNAIKSRIKDVKTITVFMGLTRLPKLTSSEISKYQTRYKLSGGPVILTVGQVKQRKGQFDTLKAIELLKQEYPDFLYVMVGSRDKNYAEKIENYAKEHGLEKNIKFVNDVKDDKTLAFFYNTCDIFALNSNNDNGHFEGFGLVMLEAAQFGKPVVGSRDCGIEDAVWDGYNGYLTNQGDTINISEKMKAILAGNRERLSRDSVEFSKKFSWDKTSEEYIRNYKNG